MNKTILVGLIFSIFLSACVQTKSVEPPLVSTSTQDNKATPLSTSTPSPIPIPSPSPTVTKIPLHPRGEIVYHPADETIAYNWYSYVPPSLNPNQLNYFWVTGMHGNYITDDYEQITKDSFPNQKLMDDANENGYIALIPVIPRPGLYQYMYPVAFSTHVFYDDTPPFLQRPDEKLNLMIDQLTSNLRTDGYQIADKILISGFSAGGMFAQRYALLNPGRVQALAAGSSGGAITFPLTSIDGYEMRWPLGISDYESLAGYAFDQQAYQELYQFIFICDMDFNNSNVMIPFYNRGRPDLVFLNGHFGNTDPVRLSNQVKYIQSIGYTNIAFKAYACDGHNFTTTMQQDMFDFFAEHKGLQGDRSMSFDKYQKFIEEIPTREPTLSATTGIVIDGYANDWSSITPFVDNLGDSLSTYSTDISKAYVTEDENYIDLLISGNPSISTIDTYILIQFSIEGFKNSKNNYNLIITPQDGAAYGGIYGQELENRNQVSSAWKQNIEVQVPKMLFSPYKFKKISFVRVMLQQNGPATAVDELLFP